MLIELTDTLPAPLPAPVATLLGLWAPKLKLKISILFSNPLTCDSPSTESISRNISTAIFQSLLGFDDDLLLVLGRPDRYFARLLGWGRKLCNEPQRNRKFV